MTVGAAPPAMTRAELRRHDGDAAPAFVAWQGRVFDVSASREWRRGLHRGLHWAGQDLTAELDAAPHGVEKLLRCPEVGRLVDDGP
jgi:predicted heme/steroid binding protein